MAKSDIAEIEHLIDEYFESLYHADSKRLSKVLHKHALYATASDEELLLMDMPTYFGVVDQREPASERGEPRIDQIVSIDFAGPKTAFVKYLCTLAGKSYIDFLTLVRDEGRWQIMSKIFHYEHV
ncbi:nuclear transport factor 2 family protein [Ruegeria arenilitoris]|uniref:nuclear transport factor 2 family protein n=1 Tax=Ruegeria arenilitoris TaxID=1173585 RepID=UPI00147A4C2F|nr:nuclear transport factor 2 family protein [Ruegeria arenilitoris]